MKKIITLLMLTVFSVSFVHAQDVTIPDANFKNALVGNPAINTNNDGEIQVSEAQATGTINVDFLNINYLTGIEEFTALTHLSCSGNILSALDVSQNKALTFLDCSINHLTELDVSQNTNLTHLYCQGNYLTSLDILANSNLTDLSCASNELSQLNLVNSVNLVNLYCVGCHLPSLELTTNTALQTLQCYYNNFTTLDVSPATSLTWLDCSHNPLTSLVTGSIPLITLSCGFTQLSDLDVSGNTSLKSLDCRYSQFQSLNVSNSTLTSLACDGNQLTGLNLLPFGALNDLSCSLNQLTNLGLSNNPNLTYLVCGDNQLQTLDLSNNPALLALSCENNQLSSLSLLNHSSLYFLDCNHNQLSSLSFPNSAALNHLRCDNNQLTNLNLSANTELNYLHCSYNQLSSLNLKNGNNGVLNFFQCFFNPPLTCIQVDDADYMNQRFGADKQSTASFSTNCGGCPTYFASLGLATGSASAVCAGSSTNLAVNITGGNSTNTYFDITYQYGIEYVTSRVFATGSNVSLPVSVAPTSTITYKLLSIIDANGCEGLIGPSNADTFEIVTVNPLPTISANLLSTANLCPGTLVRLTSSRSSTGYLWNNGKITRTINVYTDGNYSVAGNGCTSAPVTVSYLPCNAPTGISIVSNTGTTATVNFAQMSCGQSYELRYKLKAGSTWTKITDITSSPYTISGLTPNTGYKMQMRTVCNRNQLKFSDWTIVYVFKTAAAFTSNQNNQLLLNEPQSSFAISAAPNPVSTITTLAIEGTTKPVTISISDMAGKVLKIYHNITDRQYKIPVSNLAKGMYLLTVTDEAYTQTLKLVKE